MDEAPPLLPPATVAALLAATPRLITAELGAMPDALVHWRTAPDEWCALDLIGHLCEAEQRGFAGRIRELLTVDDPIFAIWDPPAVAHARADAERDTAAVLAEFTTMRDASVALVAGLRPEDLERSGRHPEVGRLTINDLLHEWLHHDREHLRQLLTFVQHAAWPRMGNAQRFSQP
jgi:hypothetical protein